MKFIEFDTNHGIQLFTNQRNSIQAIEIIRIKITRINPTVSFPVPGGGCIVPGGGWSH